jgi:hypothetical protein
MNTIISPITKSTLLNSLQVTQVGLHFNDTGVTGSNNELTSVDYSRQPCSFLPANNGVRMLESTVVFSLSGNDSVVYISYWNGVEFLLSQEISAADFSIAGLFNLKKTTTVISL